MPIYVYVTPQCSADIEKHGKRSAVASLKENVEHKQSYSEFDTYIPSPYLKKRLAGQFRLVAYQQALPNNVKVLSFVLFCHRDEGIYSDFLEKYSLDDDRIPSDEDLVEYVSKYMVSDSQKKSEEPSDIEYQMLYDRSPFSDFDDVFIFESENWIEGRGVDQAIISRHRVSIYKALRDYAFSEADDSILNIPVSDDIEIKAVSKWAHQIVFLDRLLVKRLDVDNTNNEKLNELVAAKTADESRILVQKMSHRAYPYLMLADEDYWFSIEENKEGNLSLSPEEADLVSSILESSEEDRYPLFINGRPGSGKSTILQYLYTHELSKYLSLEPKPDFYPPLYVTYSEKLMNRARDTVTSILNSSYKLLERNIKISTSELSKCFCTYSDILLSLIPAEDKDKYIKENRIDFFTFKTEWKKRRIADLPAELVWHVIRTYIKGMSSDDDFFDLSSYKELPQKQKSVTDDMFARVWQEAWLNWYSEFCSSEGRWDDQDLTRFVLSHPDITIPEFPGVFCDEAQDFTRIEIEMVSKFNLFTRRELSISDPTNIPLAFAGDPYQTINPTGFDWDAVRATFSDKLSSELCRFSNRRITIKIKDLRYNYRSNRDIVGLCNTIQLLRGIIFKKPDLIPQQSWFSDDFGVGNYYFDVDTQMFKDKFRQHNDVVIIIPCQEGEEESYLSNDPFLSEISNENPNLPLNVLSSLSAKGLEFSMVILYKFGEQCLSEHPMINELIRNPKSDFELKDRLPLEYFFNRLFVAASRPHTRCVIADTHRAIDQFWENPNITEFSSLLNKYGNPTWSLDNLFFVNIGTAETNWSEGRDDPLEIAIAMKDSAMSEKNQYKMRLAATNFMRAGKQREAEECTAWQYEFNDDYLRAAERFAALGMADKAKNLYWKAQEFQSVLNLGLEGTNEHLAAAYMLNRNDINQQIKVLDFLHDNHKVVKDIYIDPVWKLVINQLIKDIVKSNAIKQDTEIAIFMKLKGLYDARVFFDNKLMGSVSYSADRYQDAVHYWEKSKDKTILSSPDYFRAKARTLKYPENIKWHHRAKDFNEIIGLTTNKSTNKLPNDVVPILFEAYEHEKKINELLKLIETNASPQMYDIAVNSKSFLSLLSNSQVVLIYRKSLKVFDDNGHWGNIVRIINALQAKKLLDKKIMTELLILMAKSNTLQVFKEPTKSLNDLINSFIYSKKKIYTFDLSFQVTGMAIEKSNMLIDALRFYESIWRNNENIPRDHQQYAKKRWLKSKERYVFYLQDKEMNYQKHLDELNLYQKEWKIKMNTLQDYPPIDEYLEEDPRSEELYDGTVREMIRTLLNNGKFDVETVAEKLKVEVKVVREIQKELADSAEDTSDSTVLADI